jgi:hypothetical protein
MRTYYAVMLSMLCGAGIGAAGVEGLRAQAEPPIYMIGNNEVSDPDGYMKEYLPLAQATLKAHGAVMSPLERELQSTESRQKAGSLSSDGIAWSSCWPGAIRLNMRRPAKSARSTPSTMSSLLKAQIHSS